MSSGSSASLRDLYSNPPTSWAFVPSSDNNGSPNLTSRSKAPEPATPWTSARPRQNSIYELSPGLSFEPSGPNAIAVLKTFAASAILTYAGVAIEMPFEVAKRLLQVQYVPRDAKAVEDIEWDEEEDQVRMQIGSRNGELNTKEMFSTRTKTHPVRTKDTSLMRIRTLLEHVHHGQHDPQTNEVMLCDKMCRTEQQERTM